jgi:hypothetical protein
MFVARMTVKTVHSTVIFDVVDVMSGRVVLETRDAGKALRIAAELNSGAEYVRIF